MINFIILLYMSTVSGSENIAEKIISKLQTRDIFSSINKHHKKDIPCNLLLLKALAPDGTSHFAIQEYDYVNKTVSTRTPSEDESSYLSDILFLDGNKVCKYEIWGEYLKDAYIESELSFVLFSKYTDERTRTTEVNVSVCGLLFLKILHNKDFSRNLYIELICSEGRSESETIGLGSKFMKFAESIAKDGKFKKILLSSVDKPLGFYLNKGYKPVSGPSLYEIPENIKIPIFKRGKLLQSNLPKSALFLNNAGMTTTYENATRLLPPSNNNRHARRVSPRANAGKKYLGDGTIGALKGVKVSVDDSSEMVIMEKTVNHDVVAEGKKKKGRNASRKKKKNVMKKTSKKGRSKSK